MTMTPEELDARLDARLHAPGPKRILALDGGGVRGMLSLQYLERIEEQLRARAPAEHRDAFVLADYFDLIAGTSTGAIIAACLALGQSVGDITARYGTLAEKVFRRPFGSLGFFSPKFDSTALREQLGQAFGEDTRLNGTRTGLLLMTKCIDTTSPWPLHNNPRGKFHDRAEARKAGYICNLDWNLADTVRASTAAPHYFKAQKLTVAHETIDGEEQTKEANFVDGGVSVMNNPALQAFMVATLDGFRLNWPMGKDNILLASVGTGRYDPDRAMTNWAAGHALRCVLSLMDDCAEHVEAMLQWMSRSPTARPIDSEIDTLDGDLLAQCPQGPTELLTYVRYNIELSTRWLQENLPGTWDQKYVTRMARMDLPANIPDLAALGTQAAELQVPDGEDFATHFPTAFDPW